MVGIWHSVKACGEPDTIAELVEYSKGYSVVRNGQKREGVVMRNVKSNISFKVINPDFLLAEKD